MGFILNDWRLAGVLRAGSGQPYDPSFTYNTNGGNVNLTGSPDYGARIVYVGDPGSGCSSDPYRQFNVNAVTGPSTAASAWSRVATSCAAASTTAPTWRCRATSAWAVAVARVPS